MTSVFEERTMMVIRCASPSHSEAGHCSPHFVRDSLRHELFILVSDEFGESKHRVQLSCWAHLSICGDHAPECSIWFGTSTVCNPKSKQSKVKARVHQCGLLLVSAPRDNLHRCRGLAQSLPGRYFGIQGYISCLALVCSVPIAAIMCRTLCKLSESAARQP